MSAASSKQIVRSVSDSTDMERSKAEFDKALQYAAMFAKTATAPIWNVLDTSTKDNPTYTRFTKEDILQYMQAPASNEKYLRNASIYMYDASSQYRRLIQYYALLLKWNYIIVPLDFDVSKVKEETFRKQYMKVSAALEVKNLQHELQKASMIALRDGILYGAVWSAANSFYIQRINPDYCSLTSINAGTFSP